MTWEELCKKAKELGAYVGNGFIALGGNTYHKTNKECVIRDRNNINEISIFVKSYDKMLMLMEALK